MSSDTPIPLMSCFAWFSICMASSLVGASRSILGLDLSEGLLLLTRTQISGSRNDRADRKGKKAFYHNQERTITEAGL